MPSLDMPPRRNSLRLEMDDSCRKETLRIAMFVGSFPVLSETFIINQIVGLLDAGYQVSIFSLHEPRHSLTHPKVVEHNLTERCTYLRQSKASNASRLFGILTSLVTQPRWYTRRGRLLLRLCLKRTPGWERNATFKLAEQNLLEGPFDLVHCQFGDLGQKVLPLFESGVLNGKLITSIRGHDVTQSNRFDRDFYAELVRRCALFMPVSESMRGKLIELGANSEKIRIVRSGIDCKRLSYTPPSNKATKQLRIVSVARLVEMKGIEFAIRAMAMLDAENVPFSYRVIGDGPLRYELESLSQELGLRHKVVFLGPQSHETVVQQLTQADVMLMPSVTASNGEQEGLPNAIKEAMALGVLVVASDHSGIPELVIPEVTGVLTQERDVEGIAKALRTLLRDRESWDSVAHSARRMVEDEYDLPVVQQELIAGYRSVFSA